MAGACLSSTSLCRTGVSVPDGIAPARLPASAAILACVRSPPPTASITLRVTSGAGNSASSAASAVTAFEARYGVSLPEDYRAFLLEVGDGGAGPFYGVHRLDRSDLYAADREDLLPGFLAGAFPHTQSWNDLGDGSPEAEEECDDPALVRGSLNLSHQGCGYMVRLVLNGPQRGTLREDGRCSDMDITRSPLASPPGTCDGSTTPRSPDDTIMVKDLADARPARRAYRRDDVTVAAITDIGPSEVCLAWDAARRDPLIAEFTALALAAHRCPLPAGEPRQVRARSETSSF
jgi:hypothetical protein